MAFVSDPVSVNSHGEVLMVVSFNLKNWPVSCFLKSNELTVFRKDGSKTKHNISNRALSCLRQNPKILLCSVNSHGHPENALNLYVDIKDIL